jgi:CRISPR-associated endonuclease Csn1
MAVKSEELKGAPYILGLDLGAASLGWAIVGLADGKPARHIDGGVRIFPEAVKNLEQGRDEPKGAQRRSARQMRRQTDRRRRRVASAFRVLQKAGLLPPFPEGADPADSLARHDLINRLDRDLASAVPGLIDPALEHRSRSVFHYRLRALAIHQDLPPYAVGRAFLHIAQHRGFKSGRIEEASESGKGDERESKAKKERSEVKIRIESLPAEFERLGACTIGEYWSKLDPNQKRIRGLGNWSARQMHLDEFDLIWQRQAPRHPEIMTPALYRIVRRRIFYQRPLKSAAGLIGQCELEPQRRRAPLAHLLYQRFRILQTVNDLRIASSARLSRPLTPEQRAKALDVFSSRQTVTFGPLGKKLGLLPGESFSHEEGDRKDAPGNRTDCKLREVFGERWDALAEQDKNVIAGCVRSMDDSAALCRLAETRWELDHLQAARLSTVQLEQGYGRLSLAALRKLLPLMEQGLPYITAVEKVYPDRALAPMVELLPQVLDLKNVRNPAVVRALTELRKVVNGVIRLYGRPERIQIELARELKKPKDVRKSIASENRERDSLRKSAIEKIFKECGLGRPSEVDIQKAILWEECRHECPYTGASINFHDLFGSDARWEIEHIVPYSRSLDDSLTNKTLCSRETNRRKGNRTPFQAFGNTPEWEAMVERATKFQGDRRAMARKLARFTIEGGVDEILDEFTQRQLNDTKYASRLAMEYLGLLYGGVCDENGVRRVAAVSGGVTAQIRKGWRMHSILRDGPSQGEAKPRDDHRHHAIDALVVALTDAGAVQAISRASERSRLDHRHGFRVDDPWTGFLDEVRAVLGAIRVSHRPDHHLRGALHAESLYSPPRTEGGAEPRHRIRKWVSSLTPGQAGEIVDSAVRKAVEAKLKELGQADPRDAFKNNANLPALGNRHGDPVPIRRVRVFVSGSPQRIGAGASIRYVMSKDNHHLAVYRLPPGKKGTERWTGEAVNLLEAVARKQGGRPVIAPANELGAPLVMALYKGDMLEMTVPKSEPVERELFVVRGFSVERTGRPEINIVRHNRAAEIADLKGAGEWKRIRNWDEFRLLEPRIVRLDALGRVMPDGGQPNS